MRWRTIIERDSLSREYLMHIICESMNGTIEVVEPMVVRRIEPHEHVDHPFAERVQNSQGLLQSIMDASWEMGIRPTGYTGKEQKAELENHLADMRQILFGMLEIDKPK